MHAAATDAQSAALRTLLRSLGQIVLQPNAFTGACLLAAWLLCDPRLACAALMGAVAANVSAVLSGQNEDDTRAGLHGFNGALAGLAAFNFIADNATAAAVAILAATATAWLLQPWSRWLFSRGLGVFSSPYLFVTWLWLPLVAHGAAPPVSLAANSVFSIVRSGSGLFASFAQIGFASGAVAGVLVWIGIAASSWRHAWWALVGAGLACAVHLLLGAQTLDAQTNSFQAGLLGFNGALTAIALANRGAAQTFGGVLISVALQALAAYCGLPAMTAPFVLATWTVQRFGHGAMRDIDMPSVALRRDVPLRETHRPITGD